MATNFVVTGKLKLIVDPNDFLAIKKSTESALGSGVDVKVNVKGGTRQIDNIKKSFDSLQSSVKGSTDIIASFGAQAALSLRRYGAFVVATSSFYKLFGALGDAKEQAIDFEKQLLKVSQVTNKSYNELSDFRKTITQLAVGLGVSSKTLSEIAVTLSQAGLSAEDTTTALSVLAKTDLAATFDNIHNTTEGAIAVMNQFKIGAKDLEKVMSQLNAVAARYAVESSDLVTALRKTGSSAAVTGDSVEELFGVFTAIRDTTRESADSIATGLRTIFGRIERPRTIQFLREMGIELEEMGKHVNSYESLKRIAEVYSKLPQGDIRRALIIEEVGGIRQSSKVIPLLENFTKAEEARQTAVRAGLTLDKEVAIAQQGLSNRLTKLAEQFLGLTREIGDSRSFRGLVEMFLRISEAAIKMADALGQISIPLSVLAAPGLLSLSKRFFVGADTATGGFLPNLKRTRRASGGAVFSGPDGIDKIPAMLTKGEYVINKRAAQAFGYGNLDKINRYQHGGIVGPNKVDIAAIKKELESIVSSLGLGQLSKYVSNIREITQTDIAKFQKIYGKKAVLGSFTPSTKEIATSGLGNAIHEFSHAIDKGLTRYGKLFSEQHGGPIYDLIKTLQEQAQKEIAGKGFSQKYSQYYTSPKEVFARYLQQQYITSGKSGFTSTLGGLIKSQGEYQLRGNQPLTPPQYLPNRQTYMNAMGPFSAIAHSNQYQKLTERPSNWPTIYSGNTPLSRNMHPPGLSTKKPAEEGQLLGRVLIGSFITEMASGVKAFGEDAQKLIQNIAAVGTQFVILTSILKTTGRYASISESIERSSQQTLRATDRLKMFQANPTVRFGKNKNDNTRLNLSQVQERINALSVSDLFTEQGNKDYQKLTQARRILENQGNVYGQVRRRRGRELTQYRKDLQFQNRLIVGVGAGSALAQVGGNYLTDKGLGLARTSGTGGGYAAAGGALAGAATGASIGVALGPVGAAIGGLAGAAIGCAVAFNDASNAIKSFKFDENFKRGIVAINNVATGRAKASEQLGEVQQYFKQNLTNRLFEVSGDERISVQGKIEQAMPGLELFLNKLAEGSKDFDEFNNKQNGLIGIFARFSGQTIPKLEEGFKGLIDSTKRVKHVNEDFVKEQERSLLRILEIQLISRGLTNIRESLEDFENQVNMIDAAVSGRVGESRGQNVNDIFEAAERGLNPRGLQNIVGNLGLSLGAGGQDFARETLDVSRAIAELPEILHRALLRSPTEDVGAQASIEQDIAKFPIFIRQAFSAALRHDVIGGTAQEQKLTQALSTNEGFFEVVRKMGKSLEPYLETFKELGITTQKHVNFLESVYSRQRQIESEVTNIRLKGIDRLQNLEEMLASFGERPVDINKLRELEIKRRESFVAGGSTRTPEGILDEIKMRTERINNLDKNALGTNTNDILSAKQEEAIQIEKLNRLLSYMADSTNKVTIAQKALEPAINKARAKFDLAKQFVFGDTKSRRNLARTLYGSQMLASGGSVQRLPPSLRQDVLQFLENLGETKLFKNERGEAVSGKQIIARQIKEQFGLDVPDQQSEVEQLRQGLIDAFKENQKANDGLIILMGTQNENLGTIISTQNSNFLKELKSIFVDLESIRVRAEEAMLEGQQNILKKQQDAFDALKVAGIAPEMAGQVASSISDFEKYAESTNKLDVIRRLEEESETSRLLDDGVVDRSVSPGELLSRNIYGMKTGFRSEEFVNKVKEQTTANNPKLLSLVRSLGQEQDIHDIIAQIEQGNAPAKVFDEYINKRKSELQKSQKESSSNLRGFTEAQRNAVTNRFPVIKQSVEALGGTSFQDFQKSQNAAQADKEALDSRRKAIQGIGAIAGVNKPEVNAVNGIVAALQDIAKKFIEVEPVKQVKEKVTDIFNGKDGLINKLSDAITSLPQEIDGSFKHDVNVTVNGAEVMTNMIPLIETMVQKITGQTFETYLKNKGLYTELGPR